MKGLITQAVQTMSSREIAELTGKEHFHVKRDIETMLRELGEDPSSFGCIYRDSRNRGQTEYRLDRELTETLLTGYSAILRRKVIRRWKELEEQASGNIAVPTTLSAALRLAADQAEQIESQQLALAAAAPKVEFHDRYAASIGNKGFREVCKLLKANERRFRDFLIANDIMYRLGGALTPKANHIDAGRFEVKAGTNEENGHAFNQSKFTPKGVTWIAGEWAKHQLAVAQAEGEA